MTLLTLELYSSFWHNETVEGCLRYIFSKNDNVSPIVMVDPGIHNLLMVGTAIFFFIVVGTAILCLVIGWYR